MKLHQDSGIQFSLSFLVQILATVIAAVWGYSQLDARISFLDNAFATQDQQLNGIAEDIKESQDKPISSDHVQNTTLFAHERELLEVKTRVQVLENRIFDYIQQGQRP